MQNKEIRREKKTPHTYVLLWFLVQNQISYPLRDEKVRDMERARVCVLSHIP